MCFRPPSADMASADKICFKCETVNPKDAEVCIKCGYKFPKKPAMSAPTPPGAPAAPKAPQA